MLTLLLIIISLLLSTLDIYLLLYFEAKDNDKKILQLTIQNLKEHGGVGLYLALIIPVINILILVSITVILVNDKLDTIKDIPFNELFKKDKK